MTGLIQAVLYLVDAVAGFFSALFLLRFFMQWVRASFTGPLGNFVVTLTNWAVRPLRRVIPGMFGVDLASLVAAFLLQVVLYLLVFGISTGFAAPVGPEFALTLLGVALRSLLRLTIYLFIGVLIIQAVISWVNPYSPFAAPVNQLTRPILNPIRRILPPISGIDLSPMVAILLAQAFLMVI